MRLKQVTASQHELLRHLSGRISTRLEAEFLDLASADDGSIGVELRERGKRVEMSLPAALLLDASEDLASREQIRLRIKARRDRMMFRPGPAPLPKHIAATPAPSGFGRSPGPGRRRW